MRNLLEKYKKNRVNLNNAQIINILLISIITLMPFIITKAIKPVYLMGKVYYLYIISALLIIFAFKNIKIKFKKEEKLLGIFLISILISTMLSSFKTVAIFGNYFRQEGLIMFLIYGVLFILAIYYLKLNNKTLKVILFLPNIMCIYSIFELYGWNPLKSFLDVVLIEPAAMGFIGNRNFYSTYLIIFLAANFTIYILKGYKQNLINSCIQFAALICALSRSCWVAFIVISIIGVGYIYKNKMQVKRAIVSFIIFTSIFLVIDITSNGILFGRVGSLVESTINVTEESGSGRILIWKIVGELISENYFIGQGPDTLRESINMNLPERMEYFKLKYSGEIDKAHNEYLEYWASCGIVTMVSYIGLLIVISINILRNISIVKYKILFLVLIAYAVQALFNISVPSVAPIWWIFLGYCVQSYRNDEIKENEINVVT